MASKHPRPDLGTLGVLLLLATAVGWSLNFTLLKILLREWPPIFSRGVGGVAAAAALAGLAAARGDNLALPKAVIPKMLFAAFTNVFALMGFSSLSLVWLSVGEALLLIYTIPIWSTLFAWPLLGLRPTWQGSLSSLMGLAGVAILLSGQRLQFDAGQLWGVVLALGAAVLFALGTVLNSDPIRMPIVVSTAWQVGLGCAPLLVIGLAVEHPALGALTPGGAWIMAFMAFVSMGLCYLTWFGALRYLSPPIAATGLLMVPIFGAASAAAILGEPFGVRQFIAFALTLSGVALAIRSKMERRTVPRRSGIGVK